MLVSPLRPKRAADRHAGAKSKFVFYNTERLVLLRFGDVSGCAE